MALHPSQSVLQGGTPVNVFDTLTVTFQTAGPVTLCAIADFGPPSQAHAYVTTPTDDTLTAGISTIGRLINADVLRGNDPQFNLSHTCASQLPPPTTTTTTAATTTTTAASTTTSTAASTTTAPTTTSATATPTTAATTTTLTTTTSSGTSTEPTTSAVVGPATTSAVAPDSALVAVAIGAGLVMLTRRRVS